MEYTLPALLRVVLWASLSCFATGSARLADAHFASGSAAMRLAIPFTTQNPFPLAFSQDPAKTTCQSVSCIFEGRLGNILFNMCQVIAYCHKHHLPYFFPTHARACSGGKVPLAVANTGSAPVAPTIYHEPRDAQGLAYYHELPAMCNVVFKGYYQSFRYFDHSRQQVLHALHLPWVPEPGIVSIHVRRGDCIRQPEGFPMAPRVYYQKAVAYMRQRGYSRFRVYSDDQPWCMAEFHPGNFPGAVFEFSREPNEVLDFCAMSGCEHNIAARSTFSLLAGWFNQNPRKIVLCPTIKYKWWNGQNRDLLDSPCLTQIDW